MGEVERGVVTVKTNTVLLDYVTSGKHADENRRSQGSILGENVCKD